MFDRGRGKVTKLQFYQFLKAGGPGIGLPDFGYRVGGRHNMRVKGPFEGSVRRAATLNDAVETFAAHLRRWLDGHQLWVQRDGKQMWLCRFSDDGLQELQVIANQYAVMTLISLVREVAGRERTPKRVRLGAKAAEQGGAIEAIADAEVEIISSGVAIQFPAEFLSRPMLSSGVNASEALLPPDSPEEFAAAFERTLSDQLPHLGVPTIPQAAEIAGTSPRTLQRQLGADGLTYQRLIDRVRFQIARRRLQEDSGLTTRELAAELHFASPSSFVRSFRRVAGVTPGVFARTCAEQMST